MHLQRLALSNFRAFGEAVVDFPSTGVVLLAGPNSVGKSNLLSALDVVAGAAMVSSSTQHMAGGDVSITARFALANDDRIRLPMLDRYSEHYPDIEQARWAEWTFTSPRADGLRPTSISLPWRNGNTIEIAREIHQPTQVQLQLLSPNPQGAPARYENPMSGTPEMRTIDTGDYLGDLHAIANILSRWRNGYFHFPAVRGTTGREQQLRQVDTVLRPSGENLGDLLLGLKVNEPEVWRELQGLLAVILPEIGTLEVSITGNMLSVVFADPSFPGRRHNLRDMGAGVEQVLLAAIIGIAQPQAKFVAIEEPETALHPAAQRAMVELFHRWSQDRVFAVTTHSPIFLDNKNGRSRIYLLSRAEGVSHVRLADRQLIDVLEALGVRLSDVLSADRILLVEGTSDRDVLAAWWPNLTADPRVAIITGQGGRNARFASLLDNWMHQADQLNRQVLYLRDHDELSDDAAQKLKREPTVHLLERREIENYLLDPVALAYYFVAEGHEVDAATVASALRASADRLRTVVLIKSVAERLANIRVMDDDLRRYLAKNICDVDGMVEAIVRKVPSQQELDQQIRALWDEIDSSLEDRWESDWSHLAPGEEILNEIFKINLGRGYRKTVDAGRLAQHMSEPPEEIADTIVAFLGADYATRQ